MTENQEGLDPNTQEASQGKAEVSKGEGTGQLSEQGKQDGYVSKEDFDKVVAELRGLQGKLDKDASAIEKRLTSDIRDTMERLGIKLNPEQQNELRYMELEDEVRALKGEAPAKSRPETPVKVAEVFKALDISEPTAEQMKVAMEHSDNPIRLAAELTKRNLSKPNPDPSSAVVPKGVGGVVPQDAGALWNEFNSLAGRRMDDRLPSGKTVRARRDEIAKELEALEQ